ncbi:hypothetical protein RchiOBHm_Chr7g0227391 [Rosa chinensis]|uniref:Uncharacterized protein n=1 Tax=Rosa chinensis TaxID=74649 RepID=A0A2P6PEK6_ROSCH|nr:hypothetical protein RchiOBHm_Chr7g0227391 [Rosa chinensis]
MRSLNTMQTFSVFKRYKVIILSISSNLSWQNADILLYTRREEDHVRLIALL